MCYYYNFISFYTRWQILASLKTVATVATSLRYGSGEGHLEKTTSCRHLTLNQSVSGCRTSQNFSGARLSKTEVIISLLVFGGGGGRKTGEFEGIENFIVHNVYNNREFKCTIICVCSYTAVCSQLSLLWMIYTF